MLDKDTPFVRQNTPHPRELKLKAHKLFGKEKGKADDSGNLDTLSEEVCCLVSYLFFFFVCKKSYFEHDICEKFKGKNVLKIF